MRTILIFGVGITKLAGRLVVGYSWRMDTITKYATFSDLPPRWQVFCREYLVDRMKKPAARRAGISMALVGKILKDETAVAWIDERTTSAAERCELSVDWVLMELKNLKECSQDDRDWGSALRAVEGVGRHLNMFSDKLKVDSNVTINVLTGVPDRDGE
jgi:hypothetical protein